MRLLDYINPFVLIIAFCVGIFLTYVSTPAPNIVIKYPTPQNAGKVVYRDSADMCYKYKSKKVQCPADKSKIEKIKIQHIENNDDSDKGIFSSIKDKFFK